MLPFLVGLLAITGLCSFFTVVGLLLRRCLYGDWVLDWDTFGCGILGTFLGSIIYLLCHGIGGVIIRQSWKHW